MFILCYVDPRTGIARPVATAFAVVSDSRTQLLTCAQAVCWHSFAGEIRATPSTTGILPGQFFVAESVDKATGELVFVGRINVSVKTYYARGDVAVLETAYPLPSNLPFMSFCPDDDLPSARNEDVIKLYKADVQVFNDTSEMMMILEPSATDYQKVAAVSQSHILMFTPQLQGSSGGPMVDLQGRVVGMQMSARRHNVVMDVPLSPVLQNTSLDAELQANLNDAISSVAVSTAMYSTGTIPQRVIRHLGEILMNR